jgi:hypothetical protein
MSDTVDEHLERALASLAEVSTRQLHATAEALERGRNGLRAFASAFRDVAHSSELGAGPKLADFHLRQAVEHGWGRARRADRRRRGAFLAARARRCCPRLSGRSALSGVRLTI